MTHRHAAALRAAMTAAEHALWARLRRKQIAAGDGENADGVRFRRQVPLGPFIVDFACFAARLIIEVDGGQHAADASLADDAKRDGWLAAQGFRVLRFWNHEVLADVDGVVAVIDAVVRQRLAAAPPPAPSREGRGE
ncbi:MAG: endonuclease domain-containing protein [Defluviicoccus sp.]